jgi:hypothetical protein
VQQSNMHFDMLPKFICLITVAEGQRLQSESVVTDVDALSVRTMCADLTQSDRKMPNVDSFTERQRMARKESRLSLSGAWKCDPSPLHMPGPVVTPSCVSRNASSSHVLFIVKLTHYICRPQPQQSQHDPPPTHTRASTLPTPACCSSSVLLPK